MLPLDGAALESSSCPDAAVPVSVPPAASQRQLRRLVSLDEPSLPTDRLLPAADRSADVTLSTSVLAKYPESGLLRSS